MEIDDAGQFREELVAVLEEFAKKRDVTLKPDATLKYDDNELKIEVVFVEKEDRSMDELENNDKFLIGKLIGLNGEEYKVMDSKEGWILVSRIPDGKEFTVLVAALKTFTNILSITLDGKPFKIQEGQKEANHG